MRNVLLVLALAMFSALPGCNRGDPTAQGGPVAMRRLTPTQYRNSIADAFGQRIDVAGRFEPDSRRAGLNAIGTSLVSVTPSGFEQYEAIARYIASQVASLEHRDEMLPCKPASETQADDVCMEKVIRSLGRRLLRRSLDNDETRRRVEAAGATANALGEFNAGLELALTSLLVSPDFLFRIEVAVAAPLPGRPRRLQLDDLSLATRLSYFLWNRGPDDALLNAAERKELTRPEGLDREVDRMLASEHLAKGVRAFFDDLFIFDMFEDLDKDVARYPLYNNNMANDVREQTLRFVVDHLVTQKLDYPSLFTSRQLPVTRSLGPLYGVPVRQPEGWANMELSAKHGRAGLLSHASLAMLFSHAGRSSPTLRGVFLREALLCQEIPEAPADVDFALFVQDEESVHKTARDRLAVHATEASCRKCHKLTDPIGLGLEVFDGIGKYRTTENGAPIDTKSHFDGRKFADPIGLGEAFAESPLVGACLVENLYRYAVGREETNPERRLLRHLEGRFEDLGYRVPDLMREIAMSEGFRTASIPKLPAAVSAMPAQEQRSSATEVSRVDASRSAKEEI